MCTLGGTDCGVDPKTVRRYVAARDAGRPVDGTVQRLKIIDPFLGKVEEWVDRSDGTVRADVVHERLQSLAFTGYGRTTRCAVAEAKQAWRSENRRRYRPWITEPGLWLQFDWGTGPVVFGPDGRPRPTLLFCAWLAWSRFRVMLPTWDRRLGTLLTCLDTTLRRLGGVPTHGLTDNEKTVTLDHVAGVPVRHPMIVAAGATGSRCTHRPARPSTGHALARPPGVRVGEPAQDLPLHEAHERGMRMVNSHVGDWIQVPPNPVPEILREVHAEIARAPTDLSRQEVSPAHSLRQNGPRRSFVLAGSCPRISGPYPPPLPWKSREVAF